MIWAYYNRPAGRRFALPAFALAVCVLAGAQAGAQSRPAGAAGAKDSGYRLWPSAPPADCPFAASEDIVGLAFTGRCARYTGADTWYPSWASDGKMYSPFTDGAAAGARAASYVKDPSTGHATILGDDPMDLRVVDGGAVRAPARPYGGRYPCGSLVYNGVWYYGTYATMNVNGNIASDVNVEGLGRINWGVLGPFVGFRWSTDFGKTWTQTPHTPARPLFGEPAKFGGPVRIGAPHFVDFGRNMEHSPDGKAYLVAHGAVEDDPKPRVANLSWINGDQIYLLRVRPGIDTINDASKYEFFAGADGEGRPVWTSEFGRIRPLVDWNNHCGCVTMTYNAPLGKYLMCITDGWPTSKTFDTYILESDRVTGPWKLVI